MNAQFPNDRDTLRHAWNAGKRFEFYFFYGHKPPTNGVDASCFSQWFYRSFEVDGCQYPTAEHWMMAEKARLFDDLEQLNNIHGTDSPKEAKAFGRKVQGFDKDVWDANKVRIVAEGNLAKFEQNDDLNQFLQSTTGTILVLSLIHI